MTGPSSREIAARAWEMRPTWQENAVLAVVLTAVTLVFGFEWWMTVAGYVVAVPAWCAAFGWLELLNEEAAHDEDPQDAEAGDA